MTLATTLQSTVSAQLSRMTPEQFAYWLQGFAELSGGERPTPEQWKSITEHLQAVFVKVTPSLLYSGGLVGQQITPLTSRVSDQDSLITSAVC
ncbi:hypothetical protein [Pseudomonas bohemica]|uniref:hypothetical protein n=1 Tax=Pseudomonas bohemica TaxID=2044872 RepID=UPI000DA61698|nr:hypothetical protein [Pseudomonas bohemica]